VDSVLGLVSGDTEALCGVYGKFMRERGELEKEYAKGLRKLCCKYTMKPDKKGKDETTKDKAFRLILTELGYQAGQHEQLSELYMKIIPQDLKTKGKEDTKNTEKHKKDIKSLQQSVDQAQKSLEKSSNKYRKSQHERAVAEEALQKAESDRSFSRREVEKFRSIASEKERTCEESKVLHVRQAAAVRDKQEEYLQRLLPAELDKLQVMCEGNSKFLQEVWRRYVKAEQDAGTVIQACHREMEKIVMEINPETDSEMVIEQFKTGNVPSLEDGISVEAFTNTIKRSKSNTRLANDKETQTVYQQKRQLQSQIEVLEEEIVKGQKEMSGLQLMVQSYTANPKFGDAAQFKEELDRVTLRVQLHESDLYSLNEQMAEINKKLDGLRRSCSFSQKRDRSPEGSIGSSAQSDSSGYPSTGSVSSDRDNDSIEEPSDYKHRIRALMAQSEALYIPNTNVTRNSYPVENVNEQYEEEEEYLPPPPDDLLNPSPPTKPQIDNTAFPLVVALYEFSPCTEGSISMSEGEEFLLVQEDQAGWTRVKRKICQTSDDQNEGFVPTSFIRILK